MASAMTLCLLPLVFVATSSAALGRESNKNGMINPGTPPAITASFDCAVREAAYELGKRMMPMRAGFPDLYDAMQLWACKVPAPPKDDRHSWQPRGATSRSNTAGSAHVVLWVDASSAGSDTGARVGSKDRPFATMQAAVDTAARLCLPPLSGNPAPASSASNQCTIMLRGGETHYLSSTIELTRAHSGLTIQSAPGEGATVSGGILLDTRWKQSKSCQGCVETSLKGQVSKVPGLRVDGARAWKARYPNGNPEIGMSGNALHGWNTAPTRWGARVPVTENSTFYKSGKVDWPDVVWPDSPKKRSAKSGSAASMPPTMPDGEGDWGDYYIGVGGTVCNDYVPNAGYSCGARPRGMPTPGAATGLFATEKILPNAFDVDGRFRQSAYNTSGAVVHAWRPSHWFTYMWAVGEATRQQDSADNASNKDTSVLFPFTYGGFQGSEGTPEGDEWYIEGIKAELDSPYEYYFDPETAMLYFMPNATISGETSNSLRQLNEQTFVATHLKIMFNITGNQTHPAHRITLQGITLRDSAATFLDPHGMPSAGDWALQAQGAVTVEGVENFEIDGVLFERNDGNGVYLGGYVRNTTIKDSEFAWQGDTCVASWGKTTEALNANGTKTLPDGYDLGPDGRAGNQPRGTTLLRNVAHDMGIWQKQSSFYFHAVTAQANVSGNVCYNGPRAFLNFNDGFGGADDIGHNLLVNAVRESGDHGPWNSWDRSPYITNLRFNNGTGSVVPAPRRIHHNFILGNYNTQECIDTDDGSAHYETDHNIFIYGHNGLKTNFAGNNNRHRHNIYLYVEGCFYYNPCESCSTPAQVSSDAFTDNMCVYTARDGYFSNCGTYTSGIEVHNNTVFSADGTCTVCDSTSKPVSLAEWVATGHDVESKVLPWPADSTAVQWIKALLGF